MRRANEKTSSKRVRSGLMGRVKGFTLIELMVVVAISGIVAALVVPAFPAFYNESMFREEREKVNGFLRDARNQARTRQQCTSVVIDAAANTMTTTVFESCPNLKTALRNHDPVSPAAPVPTAGRTLQLSPKVQLSAFNVGATLTFVPPSGGLTSATSATLNLTRVDDSRVAEFEIFPAIGTIRSNVIVP